MRQYPVNSAQAAARIVALAAVADGRLSRVEMETARTIGLADQLGMDGPGWHEVLIALCQDLLFASHVSRLDSCRIDTAALEGMLDEIDNPELRCKVMQLCEKMTECDGVITEDESFVLRSALQRWGMAEEVSKAVPAST